MQKLWGIIANSFTETIRQPIYGWLLLGTILVLTINPALSMYTLDITDGETPLITGDNKMLKDLSLSTLLMSGLFLAAFSAAGILSREIENKTVLTVVSKPVSRPVFLLGKFLGLAGALWVAFYICSLVFLLTMRHQVMERASDQFDLPVILFGAGALLLAVILAALGNYLYDTEFASTVVGLGAVFLTIAFLLVALISPQWKIQSFGRDFMDGQLIGAAVLVFGMIMILTAVAVAVSTRLGQVMTLFVCMVVLMIGLVSDTMFGQHRQDHLWAKIAYWISPNLAFLWVTDALTQGNLINLGYVMTALLYASLTVLAYLFIGMALFQKREVG